MGERPLAESNLRRRKRCSTIQPKLNRTRARNNVQSNERGDVTGKHDTWASVQKYDQCKSTQHQRRANPRRLHACRSCMHLPFNSNSVNGEEEMNAPDSLFRRCRRCFPSLFFASSRNRLMKKILKKIVLEKNREKTLQGPSEQAKQPQCDVATARKSAVSRFSVPAEDRKTNICIWKLSRMDEVR